MIAFGRTLLASAALLLPAAASAQSNVRPIDETAADLAYGLCPLYLAGQLALDDSQLADRGFGSRVETQQNARFGTLEMVDAALADGEVAFGGAKGQVCQVVVRGPNREAALATLHKNMAYMGLDFQPATLDGPAVPGVTVETFRAAVEGQSLYVQLIQGGGTTPVVIAQLFAMDK